MFYRTADNVYRSTLLDSQSWLVHGFGTRNSDGWPGDYTDVKQIHSSLTFTADGRTGCIGRGDALVLSTPGNLIGVRTADCVPLLLADPATQTVAAVHAGWRGTAQNIAETAVQHMGREFGVHPGNLLAAIGPCIGKCCYEVGPEVEQQFVSLFPEGNATGHVDLAEANRRQLLAAGVAEANIDVSPFCTMCNGQDFESYRRDAAAAGRMVAAIGILG